MFRQKLTNVRVLRALVCYVVNAEEEESFSRYRLCLIMIGWESVLEAPIVR
jgi:hypothetical protein